GSLKLAVSLIPPSADYPIALDTFDGHRRPTRTEPDNFTLVKQRSGLALRCRVRWRGIGEGGNRPPNAECAPQNRLEPDRSQFRRLQHGRHSDISTQRRGASSTQTAKAEEGCTPRTAGACLSRHFGPGPRM